MADDVDAEKMHDNLLQEILEKLQAGIPAPALPEGDTPTKMEVLRNRTLEECEKELAFLCEYMIEDRVSAVPTKKWTSTASKALLLYAIYGVQPRPNADYPWSKFELTHAKNMIEKAATDCPHIVPLMMPMYLEFREGVLKREEDQMRKNTHRQYSY